MRNCRRKMILNPVLRVIIIGSFDSKSYLYGTPMDIIKLIWFLLKELYISHITFQTSLLGYCRKVRANINIWPEPTDININMMPFKIGRKDSIPSKYIHYWGIIEKLSVHCKTTDIAYLTIHESYVEPNETQRRPGVHTESPGILHLPGIATRKAQYSNRWGGGKNFLDKFVGGIIMTSNISDSCWVWPCQINRMEEIVPAGGNIEHLKEFLGDPISMKAGEIWWITDGTPHEARPLQTEKRVYRQFVRVVGSQVSVWFKDHSTENELGFLPKAKIIYGNKFEMQETTENSNGGKEEKSENLV